ncbi:MAG TPA: PEP-CTERM sorting domain-containing protein [Verrucomicrobiae bacterium]|nr:PEP-CTERM sorting domain-containing protein [Verrucomicrobiae bacterium]
MRKFFWIVGIAVGLVVDSAQANIIGATLDDDGDGAVTCTTTWDAGTSTLTATCKQYWSPGHMLGTVTTDTELDPTLWVINSIENDTGASWIGYQLNITMNKSFSIVGVVSPPDWTWAITQPTQSGSQWTGTLDYFSGTAVGISDAGYFGYVVSFLGSVNFAQEMIPQLIPEPASMAVLLLGAAALLGRCIRRPQDR